MSEFSYVGDELDLFARAINWKAYWTSQVRPYLKGDVLEVGAGIGANTTLLFNANVRRWVCLEPDRRLAERLVRSMPEPVRLKPDTTTEVRLKPDTTAEGRLKPDTTIDGGLRVVVGTLGALTADDRFDAVLYIDVLERIEDAARELRDAGAHLAPGGVLIVPAPAHQWLFSAFDESVGHYRRYTRRTLAAGR